MKDDSRLGRCIVPSDVVRAVVAKNRESIARTQAEPHQRTRQCRRARVERPKRDLGFGRHQRNRVSPGSRRVARLIPKQREAHDFLLLLGENAGNRFQFHDSFSLA